MKFLRTDMIKYRDEKKRALNLIWNGSDDYSFQPEFKVFDEDGQADVYYNYIIGSVYKYYNYQLLKSFFNYLKTDSDYEFYEQLTWLALENSTFLKVEKVRPVIKNLRRDYAIKVINGEVILYERAILNEIRKALFSKVIGHKADVEERVLNIANELEFDDSLDTEQIISKLDEVIKKYFKFKAGNYESTLTELPKKKKKLNNTSFESLDKEKEEEHKNSGNELMKNLIVESAETTRDVYFEQDESLKDINLNIQKLRTNKMLTDRSYIQKYYGLSIYSEQKIASIEKILCLGNHKKSRLHFTKGEFDNTTINDPEVIYNKEVAKEQKETNINYFYDNYARNNNSISNLTNKIRNTMLTNFETTVSRAKFGKLNANKIWRSIHVNDDKVFTSNIKNDIGNITVDILLDCSASQYERQDIIAAQGYIIAESLTRCQIPVKVYSFSSLRGYTIINLHRDYEENDKNNNIFNYRASGSNRDGLAIRTALYMMDNNQSENKILIVLSDCKPFDMEINPGTGIIPIKTEYSGIRGINDTAYEVKKGIMKGNKILCVFTGEDEDVLSAKKIYGHNFVRISSLDRFADTVGVLLQNQLKNL